MSHWCVKENESECKAATAAISAEQIETRRLKRGGEVTLPYPAGSAGVVWKFSWRLGETYFDGDMLNQINMETRWKSLKLLLLMILDDMVATRNEKNLLCGWNNVKKRLHSVLDPKCCLVHLQKKFQQLLNWNYLLMRWARFTKVSKCRWHVSKGHAQGQRLKAFKSSKNF